MIEEIKSPLLSQGLSGFRLAPGPLPGHKDQQLNVNRFAVT